MARRRGHMLDALLPLLLLLLLLPRDGATTEAALPSGGAPALQQSTCPGNYIIGQLGCGAYEVAEHLKDALKVPIKATQTFNQKNAPVRVQELGSSGRTFPTIDKSVNYLEDLDAPLRLKALCDFKAPPKFVVMLCDPAARTWHHFVNEGRMKATDKQTAALYTQCIERTLPVLKKCLRRNTYDQCGRLLYAGMNSGDSDVPDALGNDKPCAGVIYNSLYQQQLENWFEMFPSEDFLVLYKEDWEQSQGEMLEALSAHMSIPVVNNAPGLNLLHGAPPDTTTYAPKDAQGMLREFFDNRKGWIRHTTAPPNHPRQQSQSSDTERFDSNSL